MIGKLASALDIETSELYSSASIRVIFKFLSTVIFKNLIRISPTLL
jgi:hypothetical protein